MKCIIAVLGDEGSFSDIAAKTYCKFRKLDALEQYFPLISRVIDSVGQSTQYGIVPLENSIDGYLQYHMDLLLESDLLIMDEWVLPIRFDFVGNVLSKEHIDTIYAQYATIGQCQKFLKDYPNAKIVVTNSNTDTFTQFQTAAPNSGAIISSHMTVGSDYRYLQENIMDYEQNHTRFVIVQKKEIELDLSQTTNVKATFVVTPKIDYPGLLYEILQEFSIQKINLVSIMSRPIKTQMGRYHFFFELIAPSKNLKLVKATLDRLSKRFSLRILGIYPERLINEHL